MNCGALCEALVIIRAAVIALTIGGACEPTCNDADPERVVPYEGGVTNAAGVVYQTSPIGGPYVEFPAGTTLEIAHRLPGAPTHVHADVAFEERPFPHGFSGAAGDMAVFTCADDTVLLVMNTTCQRFYLRVTASYDDFSDPAAEPCE